MPFWSNLIAMVRRPDVYAKPAEPIQVAADMYAKATSPDVAAFVAQFEGFRAAPYLCPAGVPTIGYGTTVYPSGHRVTLADPACSKAQAQAWLAHDLVAAGAAVDRYVKAPISAGQRVALMSFVYNLGEGAFAASTMLKLINARRFGDAGREFGRWVKAGGVTLPGLVTRRQAERELWDAG